MTSKAFFKRKTNKMIICEQLMHVLPKQLQYGTTVSVFQWHNVCRHNVQEDPTYSAVSNDTVRQKTMT